MAKKLKISIQKSISNDILRFYEIPCKTNIKIKSSTNNKLLDLLNEKYG